MAFNLTDRISNGRMKDDPGSGFRGNPADYTFNASTGDRGGAGDDEGSNKGGPHSASGFRRALEHTERTAGTLSAKIMSGQDSSGSGFKKPNYFGQGGKRHGMHIGSGSPFTGAASQEGADTGM
jgi:hypothetical protein